MSWISFFISIFIIKLSSAITSEAFREDLFATESFFEKLTNDYGSILHGQDEVKELEVKISKFVETLQTPIRWRHRRHLDEHPHRAENGIGVLTGFSTVIEDPFPNAIVISIFAHYDGIQLHRFAATLDASELSLYLYNGNLFDEISSYPVTNGSCLIADCSELGCVLVMSRIDGSITVLRLLHEIGGFVLRPVQYLRGLGNVRLSIWHEMNQMFLGIASSNNISVYHWLGEHFDSIQVLNYGTEQLTPFKIGGSLYLALTGARSTILKFLLEPNAFVLAQRLPQSHDAESFYMEKGHLREHYLVLTNHESTIIYKFVNDHFTPFQKIEKADDISSITTSETVILFALTQNSLKIYQYDGWKFVELGVLMPEVDSFHPTSLDGEIVLIVRHTNGTWKFNELIWTKKSTWEILRGKIKAWCLDRIERAKRLPPKIPKINGPVRILRGHIGQLRTKSINGRSTEKLISLANQFEELRSNLSGNEKIFSQLMTRNNPKFNTLYASNVSGECTLGCKIGSLETSVKAPILENLARSNFMYQTLEFENVRTRSLGDLICPRPAVELKDVTVSGTVNGIAFESFKENLLRVTGDQEVTGEHIYLNFSASSTIIPLGIATRSTHQELHAQSIKANNLYLTQGGILLPLNGQPVTINETKILAKAKVTGPVHLRGSLSGKGVNHLAPATWIEKPLELWGNYSLQKVTVQNQASTSDLVFKNARSLTAIINEGIRVGEDVPVHLKLSKAKTTWTNITANLTADYITVSTGGSLFRYVTGTKYCSNNLTITNSSYESLAVPKFQKSLCASEATLGDVETSLVSVGRASADILKTVHLIGAPILNDVISDTATLSQNLTLCPKIFTGVVNIRQANLDAIDGIDFKKLLAAMVGWREPGLIGGLVEASNIAIKHLVVPNGFVPPLITKSMNLISEGNINFGTLNGVDFSKLAELVVKLDEPISLVNVTFAGGLRATEVETVWAPVDTSGPKNMGVKTIAGSLKSTHIRLPNSFIYPPADTSASLIIKGSATFAKEPEVENINNRNLTEISERIWFTNRPSILSNRVFVVRHMVLEGPVKILGWLNSQNYGPWNQISERLLSLSKPQEIKTHLYLNAATVPNILSEKELKLSVPEIFLDGLGNQSLRKDGSQIITTAMRFQKLIILDDLNTRSKINGKNLSTDIVRFDVKENIITGKVTVLSLWADNINGGFNFGAWQKNAMRISNNGEPVYIKGIKTFGNISFANPLRVEGLVNGRRVENFLLKSSPQKLSGMKKIYGTVYAPNIFIDGLVNDINFTSMIEHQLKRDKKVQTIKTRILTKGDVTITGNITVNGFYHGVEFKGLGNINADLEMVGKRMTDLKNVAKEIQTALSRRAWYWNKLELVESNSKLLTPKSEDLSSVTFEGLGSCTSRDGALTCDNETVQLLIFTPNSSRILFNQVFQLAGIPLVVFATSDPNGGVWIYTYENVEKKFHQIAGLNLPGATQVSAAVTGGSLWLAIQLTWDTVILRYDRFDQYTGQFEEYNLPGTDLLFMEIAPTGELLIYRSDGVWRLGGLSGPRQLAKAQLNGEIDTFVIENNYFVQLRGYNNAKLLKTRYVGN